MPAFTCYKFQSCSLWASLWQQDASKTAKTGKNGQYSTM